MKHKRKEHPFLQDKYIKDNIVVQRNNEEFRVGDEATLNLDFNNYQI
jgi:hypothetical protein